VRFGGVLAVNGVSFDVQRGEVFTLIGPNGAGKTTVFNLISRIYTPTAGSIEFDGQPTHRRAGRTAIAGLGIARTFQNIELFEYATRAAEPADRAPRASHAPASGSELLLHARACAAPRCRPREAVEEVIDFLDLQHHRDCLVAGLPYGVRKVVELARALCHRARAAAARRARPPA
jgi:branched-chain amino acid transport system ATP-binding protein